jgi:hypothetical protein
MPQALPSLRLVIEVQPPCQLVKLNKINSLSKNRGCAARAKRTVSGRDPAKDSDLGRRGKYLLTIPTYL